MFPSASRLLGAAGLFGGDSDPFPWCDDDSDPFPWCDDHVIGLSLSLSSPVPSPGGAPSPSQFSLAAGCDLNPLGSEGEETEGKFMSLSWGLVHSRVPANVNRGIMILLASVDTEGAFPLKKKHYLIAIGHFRNKEYGKCVDHLNICLQMDPEWNQALLLQRILRDKIKRDGAIGICIATGAVGALGFATAGILGAIGAVTIAAGGVVTMVRRT